MKKQLPRLIIFSYIIVFLFTGCVTREDALQPEACFSYIPSGDIYPGDDVTFTNCSTDGETYYWDFGDGQDSYSMNPVHVYDEPGTYTVSVLVTNKSLKDETSQRITVISNVKACFTMSANPVAIEETVYFSNCSTNADSYEWDIDGNGTIDSEDKNPAFYYTNAGTYNVKLIAKSGSFSDEVVHSITVTEQTVTIDPTVYDIPVNWITYYASEFDDATDWTEASDVDYNKVIENGFYKLTNYNLESSYYFWTNAVAMPPSTMNYDFEAWMYIEYDNVTQGDGLFWGLDPDSFDYYYYRYTLYNEINYYIIGDSQNGSYLSNTWGTSSSFNSYDYNKLTVRNYAGKYYIFINEVFLGSYNAFGDFGEKFGFVVGADSKLEVDWAGFWEMDLSRKSTTGLKSFDNPVLDKLPQGVDFLEEGRKQEQVKN